MWHAYVIFLMGIGIGMDVDAWHRGHMSGWITTLGIALCVIAAVLNAISLQRLMRKP